MFWRAPEPVLFDAQRLIAAADQAAFVPRPYSHNRRSRHHQLALVAVSSAASTDVTTARRRRERREKTASQYWRRSCQSWKQYLIHLPQYGCCILEATTATEIYTLSLHDALPI